MNHLPLNAEERSALTAQRTVGLNQSEIARKLGRHRHSYSRRREIPTQSSNPA